MTEKSAESEVDLEHMLHDPASHYSSPLDVVDDSRLGLEEKLRLLRQWERDARALAVAEDENMSGGEPSLLSSVLQALGSLGAGPNPAGSDASNHGQRRGKGF